MAGAIEERRKMMIEYCKKHSPEGEDHGPEMSYHDDTDNPLPLYSFCLSCLADIVEAHGGHVWRRKDD